MTARKKKSKTAKASAKAARSAKPVKSAASAASAAAAPSPPSNLAEILSSASSLADSGHFDEASRLFSRAADLAPKNVQVLDRLAEALMEAGRPDEAVPALRRAIALAPARGFEKYMYLAQLLGNSMEAVDVARAGIEVLRREKDVPGGAAERLEELAAYEVSALCNVAECLLGFIEESNDQAVADRLDGQVELAVGEALAVCRPGTVGEIEAAMALANLRLSQGREADARVAMERAVGAMREGLVLLEEEGNGDAGENIARGLEMLPPSEMRIAVGKQLVEVKLWQDAVQVLSSTLYECDFNVEVWYMLVAAFFSANEKEQARDALQSLKDTLASPDGFAGELAEDAVSQLESLLGGQDAATGDPSDKMED